MRVVLLGPYPPYRGGIAHFATTVRRELAARGHDVWAITFSRQYPSFLFPGRTEFENRPSTEVIPAPRMLDSLNPLSWRRTGRRIRQIDPQAVIYSYWLPFFAPAYARVMRASGRGRRHVAIVHNALPHERKPGDALLTRYFLRRCDAILTMSEQVENDVVRLIPQAAVQRVAHPIYDLFGDPPSAAEARRALGLPADGPVGLFFGFVRPYKGLQVLLAALPAIVAAVPDFRLVVAGEFYEPRARYEKMIDAAGLAEHVLLVDAYIASEEVGRYFAAADVVIQPYVSATQSGVAQIAWRFGKPLIVTDVGGLAEVVPHEVAGLVVNPNDPAGLASAVVRFFRDDLHDRLRDGALEQREKYGWDPLVDTLEQMAGIDT